MTDFEHGCIHTYMPQQQNQQHVSSNRYGNRDGYLQWPSGKQTGRSAAIPLNSLIIYNSNLKVIIPIYFSARSGDVNLNSFMEWCCCPQPLDPPPSSWGIHNNSVEGQFRKWATERSFLAAYESGAKVMFHYRVSRSNRKDSIEQIDYGGYFKKELIKALYVNRKPSAKRGTKFRRVLKPGLVLFIFGQDIGSRIQDRCPNINCTNPGLETL